MKATFIPVRHQREGDVVWVDIDDAPDDWRLADLHGRLVARGQEGSVVVLWPGARGSPLALAFDRGGALVANNPIDRIAHPALAAARTNIERVFEQARTPWKPPETEAFSWSQLLGSAAFWEVYYQRLGYCDGLDLASVVVDLATFDTTRELVFRDAAYRQMLCAFVLPEMTDSERSASSPIYPGYGLKPRFDATNARLDLAHANGDLLRIEFDVMGPIYTRVTATSEIRLGHVDAHGSPPRFRRRDLATLGTADGVTAGQVLLLFAPFVRPRGPRAWHAALLAAGCRRSFADQVIERARREDSGLG